MSVGAFLFESFLFESFLFESFLFESFLFESFLWKCPDLILAILLYIHGRHFPRLGGPSHFENLTHPLPAGYTLY